MSARLRGRELYIIVGVVAVVIAVLWYFFLFTPERKKYSDLTAQYQTEQTTLTATQQKITQYEAYKKTAPQAEADLIRLHKVMPAEDAIPSFLVSLTQTAKASGLSVTSITPQENAPGVPFTVQPIQFIVDGRYFDVEDFLYRLQNDVEIRNQQFLVTGRLFAVVGLSFAQSSNHGTYPYVSVTLTVNGFQWSPSGSTSTTTTTTAGGS